MSEKIAEKIAARLPWLDGSKIDTFTDVQLADLVQAESFYRKAVEVNQDDAAAYTYLARILQLQGDLDGAVTNYHKALEINPQFQAARRSLALLLVKLTRSDESFPLWYEILRESKGLEWVHQIISISMQARDLSLAGESAKILAELRWGSPLYLRRQSSLLNLPIHSPEVFLSIPKLRHDIEQFEYLQSKGLLGKEFTEIIKEYKEVIKQLMPQGIDVRKPLSPQQSKTIGKVYNRIVHIRHSPRVQGPPWGNWNAREVENQYLSRALGLVVVDDFLSKEVLEELRLFCLESTVWSANRYAHGRLGAFFYDGFNSPLLLQIAEEIRKALPRIIIDRYPLRQVWGFKNEEVLPAGSTTHADFAAVNVNFWITPDDANLDASSGGLIVYDVDAPITWDFATYNGRSDIINPFLQLKQSREITIPYRQNRAIIFNSDLFHASAGLRFRPGYENRRINITMLYGERESDVHHPNLAGQSMMEGSNFRPAAWRSAAFLLARTSSAGKV